MTVWISTEYNEYAHDYEIPDGFDLEDFLNSLERFHSAMKKAQRGVAEMYKQELIKDIEEL